MRMQSYLGAAIGVMVVGAVFAACKSSDTNATPAGVKCTPGNYVFCRCEDRSEGTKLCRPDAVSFDTCVCDGSQPPPTQDPDSGMIISTPPVEIDAGPVTGPIIDAKCAGKMGLVAGGVTTDGTDHDAFLASYTGAGMFAVSKSTGLGVRGPITILPVGGSLVATYLGTYQYMGFTKLTAGTWSTPSSLGDGTADPSKPTSMVLLNGELRAFYLNSGDGLYHMQSYSDTTGWAPDALGPGTIAEPSGDSGAPVSGKSAPAVGSTGTSMTLLFTGDDGTLAREQYSGSWTFTKFSNATAYPSTPAIVGLDNPGGTRNELLVYAGSDLLIHVAARVASNGSWNAPILFDTAASSTDFALQALPSGKAILVYRDAANKGFYSVWSEATGFGPPLALVTGTNPELASVPSIARGTCGSDVTIAYAQKADGLVKILRYSAGTMTGPFDVNGITKATWVGVGELP